MGRTFFCVFSFLLVYAAAAHAGSLTINGSSDLHFSVENDQLKIDGSYSIENKGDETAKEVFPSLELGHWSWAGDPKQLDQSKKETWIINTTIPLTELNCTAKDLCAGLKLPLSGALPLLVRRHYQDLNGYRFSAADIELIEIGDIPGEARAAIRTPDLDGKLSFDGDGQEFVGTVEFINASAEPRKVALGVHTSRELKVTGPAQVVEIPGNGTKKTRIVLENFRGIAGSSYAVFAIAQWEENGVRYSQKFSSAVRLETRRHGGDYLLVGIGVAFLLALVVYVTVFRQRRAAT